MAKEHRPSYTSVVDRGELGSMPSIAPNSSSMAQDESLSRNDFLTILEVNKKVIELNIEVEKQNSRIINTLCDLEIEIKDQDSKVDKIIDIGKSLEKDFYTKSRDFDRLLDSQKNIYSGLETVVSKQSALSKDFDTIINKQVALTDKIAVIEKASESLKESHFKLQILLGSGVLAMITQLVQMFLVKK